MKQWVSLVLVLLVPATLLVLEVEARPSAGEGQSGPTAMLRRMFAIQMCAEKDAENCEQRMNECMEMLYPGAGLPIGAPNMEDICGGDFACRREAIRCLMFMQPNDAPEILSPESEPEPEPEVEAACQRENLTIFECKDKMMECMDMIQPEPTGIPDEDEVCSQSLDSDCSVKYKTCMRLMNAADKAKDKMEEMICEDMQVDNCHARATKCHNFIHPDREFHNAMKKCFVKSPDCPLAPRMDVQDHAGLMKCMEPALKKHVESIDSKVVRPLARDSCLKEDNLKGAFMCLMRDCIPIIPM